jgi:hypothetical protein
MPFLVSNLRHISIFVRQTPTGSSSCVALRDYSLFEKTRYRHTCLPWPNLTYPEGLRKARIDFPREAALWEWSSHRLSAEMLALFHSFSLPLVTSNNCNIFGRLTLYISFNKWRTVCKFMVMKFRCLVLPPRRTKKEIEGKLSDITSEHIGCLRSCFTEITVIYLSPEQSATHVTTDDRKTSYSHRVAISCKLKPERQWKQSQLCT